MAICSPRTAPQHTRQIHARPSRRLARTIDYDRNGNLTYDGTQKYSYDAWNRLVGVAHAYRSSGTVYAGQKSVTMSYDGKGRRIGKAISNTGQWDCTYKYFYDNDSCIEEWNGSDRTVKQMVWGTNYIDELVQIGVQDYVEFSPGGGGPQHMDRFNWVCQDANYNVLGVVNSAGGLVERYEYSPYGERKVFYSAGADDPKCYASSLAGKRAESIDWGTQPFGLCEFGHQGLMHDEEVDLVYNRAREMHPSLGRFMQRDPRGYTDSLSHYLYAGSRPVLAVDPIGDVWFIAKPALGWLANYTRGAIGEVTFAGQWCFSYSSQNPIGPKTCSKGETRYLIGTEYVKLKMYDVLAPVSSYDTETNEVTGFSPGGNPVYSESCIKREVWGCYCQCGGWAPLQYETTQRSDSYNVATNSDGIPTYGVTKVIYEQRKMNGIYCSFNDSKCCGGK